MNMKEIITRSAYTCFRSFSYLIQKLKKFILLLRAKRHVPAKYQWLLTCREENTKVVMDWVNTSTNVDKEWRKLVPNGQSAFQLSIDLIPHLLMLNDIIGIQPMTNPVGLASALRYKREGDNVLSLTVGNFPIVARSMKLSASWPITLVSDLTHMHGINAVDEIRNILSTEVTNELYARILREIQQNATITSVDISDVSGEEAAKWLHLQINKSSNTVARNTRRGRGNVVLASMDLADILWSDPAFIKSTSDKNYHTQPQAGLMYVGNMATGQRVYCAVDLPMGTAVIGYRGKQAIDCGYSLHPYQLRTHGPVINPLDSLESPAHNITMRLATSSLTDQPFTDNNYYTVLKVQEPTTENV